MEGLRARIDGIDRRLVRLLNERAGCAIALGRIKRRRGLTIYQPAREEEVLGNVQRSNGGPLESAALLHEIGANVEIVARTQQIRWLGGVVSRTIHRGFGPERVAGRAPWLRVGTGTSRRGRGLKRPPDCPGRRRSGGKAHGHRDE